MAVCLVSHHRRVHELPVHSQEKAIIVHFRQTEATTAYKPEGRYASSDQSQDRGFRSNT